jgi:hypothetical protein
MREWVGGGCRQGIEVVEVVRGETKDRSELMTTVTSNALGGSSKVTSPRNHEELRSRALFEHRHQHRKAPALAGPLDAEPPD